MLDYILEVDYLAERRDVDDRVEAILFLTTCAGSTIDERDGRTLVSCYFRDRESRDNAHSMLHQIDGVDLNDVDREKVDWLHLYQQSLEPIVVGERFVIVPDESLVSPSSSRLPIVIPQERAFGTGSHASTALCLEMLETLSLEGATGIDIGTGSGILAIALVRLGCRSVIALDNDFDTFGIVEKNLKRNAVEKGRVLQFFGTPDAVGGSGFDVATMNIIPEVIVPLLPKVQSLLSPGAALIVSGVLSERREEVLQRAERTGLQLIADRIGGEWWCGRFANSIMSY